VSSILLIILHRNKGLAGTGKIITTLLSRQESVGRQNIQQMLKIFTEIVDG